MERDLDSYGEGLARAFFTGANAPLLAELRKRTEAEQEREALRETVGIKDETFLRRLQALGVRSEAAVALVMVPLVLVAWGDGTLDEKERAAILEAAQQRGIAAERIARELLKNGLARKPDPKLLPTWIAYARRLWGRFTADERWAMRENLLRSARQVAEATGGLFGLTSRVSAGERKVLHEIEAVLD
jgi:tellurite resistance protein